MYVAAVRHLFLNQTDNFGQCSIVELVITSESYAYKLTSDCIVIKIYYIKQLNHNTDIIHIGWHLYLYNIEQFLHAVMLQARNADVWHKRWDLTDVDSLSLLRILTCLRPLHYVVLLHFNVSFKGRNRDSGLIAGYRRLLDVRCVKNIYRRRS